MKRSFGFIAFSTLFFLALASSASGQDTTAPAPSPDGMHHPKADSESRGQMGMGMGGMCPKMHQRMDMGRMKGDGPHAGTSPRREAFRGPGHATWTQFMRGFHAWTGCLMFHRQAIGLTEAQLSRLEDMISDHLAFALRKEAEIRALSIILKQKIRKTPLDLEDIGRRIQAISGQQTELQMEGIRLYAGILGMLNEDQKKKLEDTIGSAFPPPWEGVSSEWCPRRGAALNDAGSVSPKGAQEQPSGGSKGTPAS